MALQMIYIFPMMLGTTFDLLHYRNGVNIFPSDQLALRRTQPHYLLSSGTTLITSLSDNILHIPVDLSLKIKAGDVDLKEAGEFLKEFGMTENTIYILVSTTAYCLVEDLPYEAKPFSNWTEYKQTHLGTHYVQGVEYGTDLVVSLRIRIHEERNRNNVTDTLVKASITLENLFEKYKELKKILRGTADIKLSFFSNIPLEGIPQTLEGLKTVVDRLKRKDNVTFPARVLLEELSALDESFSFERNTLLMIRLKMFERNFDDVRRAKAFATKWVRTVSKKLNVEEKQKIDGYLDRVNDILKSFLETIRLLNVQNGPQQLENSMEAYRAKGSAINGKYVREFYRLRNEITKGSILHNPNE